MEIPTFSHSAATLLEALEKLGASKGANLRSPDGPGAPPQQDLVKAFEALLEGGSDQNALPPDTLPPPVVESIAENAPDRFLGEPYDATATSATSTTSTAPLPRPEGDMGTTTFIQPDAPVMPRVTGLIGVPQNEAPGSVAENGADVAERFRVGPSRQLDTPEAMLREVVGLVGKISGGELAPTELYRLQYLLGILKVQAVSGTQVSQQSSQGLESLLKQQG